MIVILVSKLNLLTVGPAGLLVVEFNTRPSGPSSSNYN